MQLIVQVDQKEAIRRGKNSDSTCKLEVDIAQLPEDVRKVISETFDAGRCNLKVPEPTVDGLLEAAREVMAEEVEHAKILAEAKVKALELEKEFLASSADDLLEFFSHINCWKRRIIKKYGLEWHHGELQVRLPKSVRTSPGSWANVYCFSSEAAKAHAMTIIAEGERRNEELARPEREAESKRIAEAETLKTAKESQVKETIDRLGSEGERLLLERGLLNNPEIEAVKLVSEEVFGKLNLPVYIELTEADLEVPEDWDDREDLPEVKWDWDNENQIPAGNISPEQMLQIAAVEKAIKAVLPEAKTAILQQSITRDHHDWPWVHRYAVEAKLDVGLLTARRLFATDSSTH